MLTDKELLSRIEVDPEICVGQPRIQGTRLTVAHILRLLAYGTGPKGILKEYPDLHALDISACLLFAAQTVVRDSFLDDDYDEEFK